MSANKKKIIIGAIVICLIVLIVAAVAGKSTSDGEDATAGGDSTLAESSSSMEERSTESDDGKQTAESATETEEQTAEEKNESSEETSGGSGNISGAGSFIANETKNSTEGENNQNEDVISCPYAVSGTTLTIQKIGGYSGVFIEDGSDEDISDVTALLLENTGDINVEYVSLTLNRDGETLEFEASDIPAGASVVVQEKNKAAYQDGTYSDCDAMSAELDTFEMSEDQVKVEETEDGSLKVTNLTSEEIPCIRIFYKFYMEDENAYIGGITYTAKLTEVAAGSSQTVRPSHYSAGYSKITMVRTYDSADDE